MTLAIQPTVSSLPSSGNFGAFAENIKEKACDVFAKVMHKITPSSQGEGLKQQITHFRSFLDRTEVVIEGGIWGAFWVGGVFFVAESLHKLYAVLTVEHAASEKFEKIGLAVKNAFVDIISLVNSSAHIVSWSDTVEIISLGKYLPFIKNLCFGTSLVINTVEAGADIYTIWSIKEAILAEKLPAKREIHKQFFCHALIKLISNVSMVAWGSPWACCVCRSGRHSRSHYSFANCWLCDWFCCDFLQSTG